MSSPNFTSLITCVMAQPSTVLPPLYDLYAILTKITPDETVKNISFSFYTTLTGLDTSENVSIRVENSQGHVVYQSNVLTEESDRLQTHYIVGRITLPAVHDRYAVIASCRDASVISSLTVGP